MSSNATITALISIDTERVKQLHPIASQDEKNPTTLGLNDLCAFMIVSGSTKVEGQGTWFLKFNALVGDTLRSSAASASNNFDDAVVLYGFKLNSGSPVAGKFEYKEFTKKSPMGGESSPLPAEMVETRFRFFQSDVKRTGKASFNANFAIYNRDSNGKYAVQGYYSWDPTIEVLG